MPNLNIQVDNLHVKASNLVLSSLRGGPPSIHAPDLPTSQRPPAKPRILELHGTLAKVHCLEHLHEQPRDSYQGELAGMNPIWDKEAQEAERTGR